MLRLVAVGAACWLAVQPTAALSAPALEGCLSRDEALRQIGDVAKTSWRTLDRQTLVTTHADLEPAAYDKSGRPTMYIRQGRIINGEVQCGESYAFDLGSQ